MELNPNNRVAAAARGQWHTIAALIMHKLGVNHVEIKMEDSDAFAKRKMNIGIADDKGYMEIFLLNEKESIEAIRKHKGTIQDG